MPAEKQTQEQLNAAVETAAAQIEAQLSGTTPPAEPAVPETETPAAEAETPESAVVAEIDELTEQELAESKNLWKMLKDPNTARGVVAALAEQTGVLREYAEGRQTPTAAETRTAKKDIQTIFKESLGKEYDFLADRLSKAVDTVLAQEREEQSQRLLEVEAAQLNREVIVELDKLNTATKGASKPLENRIAELSKEIPSGEMNTATYLRRLYAIASSERGIPAVPKVGGPAKADRIRSNANDATSRLSSTAVNRSSGPEIPKEKMKIGDAVKWAMNEINKGK